MHKQYLLLAIAAAIAASPASEAQQVGDKVIVTTENARLRVPGADVGRVPELTALTVENVNGDWLWVTHNGVSGWVSRRDAKSRNDALSHYDALANTREYYLFKAAMVASELDRFREAAELWRQYGSVSDSSFAWTEHARMHDLMLKTDGVSDFDAVKAKYDDCVRKYPGEAHVFRSRAAFFADHGEPIRALADHFHAIQLAPDETSAVFSYIPLGRDCLARGDLSRAEKFAQRAVDAGSEFYGAELLRGEVRLAQNDLDGAWSDIARALQKATPPDREFVFRMRARWRRARALGGDLREAIADYRAAMAGLSPEQTVFYRQEICETRLALNDASGAMAESRAVLAIAGGDAYSHCLHAQALWKARRFAESTQAYERAYADAPFEPMYANGLAWALSTSSQPDPQKAAERAIELATYVCESDNFNAPSHLDTLAAAYARRGDFKKARTFQSRAWALATDDDRLKADYASRLRLYEQERAFSVTSSDGSE